ncbi:MAG: 1,2-phenylacetyl-CoA epoxidase subunit PaaD [Streptosporangiaceae bacterium]
MVSAGSVPAARQIAEAVADPELPMLTLADLGILRDVAAEDGHIVVTITPTYSGCPALAEIARDLQHRLTQAGFAGSTVRTQIAPAWSSDWITPQGRRKLRAAGIAPPRPSANRPSANRPSANGSAAAGPASRGPVPLNLTAAPRGRVACPQCGSLDTVATAAFGSTACKALLRCDTCHEPFEYVKEF